MVVVLFRKEKLKSLDQCTRKVMTMNKELNPKAACTEQERRWKRTYTSVESRIRAEENSLAK